MKTARSVTQVRVSLSTLLSLSVVMFLTSCSQNTNTGEQKSSQMPSPTSGITKEELTYFQNPTVAAAAIKQNPDDVAAHRALVTYHSMRRDSKQVVTHLREVVRLSPDDKQQALSLAFHLRRMGQEEAAVRILQELAVQPDDVGRNAQKMLRQMGK